MDTQIPEVYKAISEVMGALAKEGIAKNQSNKQQNYKFRGIDDVYNALATILAAKKLCILPSVRNREVVERRSQGGGALFYVTVMVDYTFASAIDGSQHTVTVVGEAMDSGDKATNKAMSAAFKYACLQAFCIPTEGDNDADETTHEVAAKDYILPPKTPPPTTRPTTRTPTSEETSIVGGITKAHVLKEGVTPDGKQWVKYGIETEDRKFSTFSKTVYDDALWAQAQKLEVNISYTSDKYGDTIPSKGLTVIE